MPAASSTSSRTPIPIVIRLAFIGSHPIVRVMLRKAAFLALVPLILAGADTPLGKPLYTVRPCPGADLAGAMPAVRRLFAENPETRAVLITANGCPALKAYAPGYSDAN